MASKEKNAEYQDMERRIIESDIQDTMVRT